MLDANQFVARLNVVYDAGIALGRSIKAATSAPLPTSIDLTKASDVRSVLLGSDTLLSLAEHPAAAKSAAVAQNVESMKRAITPLEDLDETDLTTADAAVLALRHLFIVSNAIASLQMTPDEVAILQAIPAVTEPSTPFDQAGSHLVDALRTALPERFDLQRSVDAFAAAIDAISTAPASGLRH